MNVAIIVAAGQGVRMGSKRAKQFLALDGIPVIIHTLTRFEQCPDVDEVVVVLPEKDVKRFPALARQYGLNKVIRSIAGGKTRAQSVQLGLESFQEKKIKIVAVHDGVRPFVTPAEISQTISKAKRNRAAILVAPVTDTIKLVPYKTVRHTFRRDELRRALTPQCFHYALLRQAFANIRSKALAKHITDDSMLVERIVKVSTVAGNPRNIKITKPEDIALAEIILKQNPEFRIKKPK
jgi:2-C-methyl-D-erythritol 4-phosphate cytidylyltransferase